MKLVCYELRKLSGMRFLWILLILMTVLCSVLFYYESDAVNAASDFNNAMNDLLREYQKSPERIDAAYEKYKEYQNRKNEVRDEYYYSLGGEIPDDDFYNGMENALAGIEYTNTLGYYYSDGSLIPDEVMFAALERSLDADNHFRQEISKVIGAVEGTLKLYETIGAVDTPVYEYERHFYDVYTNVLANTVIEPVYVYGWMQFFSYDEISIFIAAYLILAAGVVFLYERSCGTFSMIRTTRKGRIKSITAKLTAMIIMTVTAVAVFTAGVAVMCFVTFGFSPATAPVQAALTHCPYTVSLGEYALMMLSVRAMGAVMFSCAIAFVSSLTFSSVATYISGAVLLIANVIINFFITSGNWLSLNLVSFMGADGIMSQHSEVLFLNRYYNTLLIGIIIYSIISLMLALLTVTLSGKRGSAQSVTESKLKVTLSIKEKKFVLVHPRNSKCNRSYPKNLLSWEFSKIFTPTTVIVIIFLFVMSGYESYDYYNAHGRSGQKSYEDYINEHLFGTYDEESKSFFEKRYSIASELTSEETERDMISKYERGELISEELFVYFTERDSAAVELNILKTAGNQINYLLELEAETGVRGWVFYDADLRRILDRDINIFLLAAVVIAVSRIYPIEYIGKSSEGAFTSILSTTKRGRRNTFRAKILSSLVISFVITAIFTVLDFALGIASVERLVEMLSAPIMSMQEFRSLDSALTVGGYISLMLALRFWGYMILSLLTVSASYIVKKIPTTLFITAMFTLLPYTLVYMGILALRFIDFTALLAGGKLIMRSAELSTGSTWSFAVIFIVIYTAVTATALVCERRSIGK